MIVEKYYKYTNLFFKSRYQFMLKTAIFMHLNFRGFMSLNITVIFRNRFTSLKKNQKTA